MFFKNVVTVIVLCSFTSLFSSESTDKVGYYDETGLFIIGSRPSDSGKATAQQPQQQSPQEQPLAQGVALHMPMQQLPGNQMQAHHQMAQPQLFQQPYGGPFVHQGYPQRMQGPVMQQPYGIYQGQQHMYNLMQYAGCSTQAPMAYSYPLMQPQPVASFASSVGNNHTGKTYVRVDGVLYEVLSEEDYLKQKLVETQKTVEAQQQAMLIQQQKNQQAIYMQQEQMLQLQEKLVAQRQALAQQHTAEGQNNLSRLEQLVQDLAVKEADLKKAADDAEQQAALKQKEYEALLKKQEEQKRQQQIEEDERNQKAAAQEQQEQEAAEKTRQQQLQQEALKKTLVEEQRIKEEEQERQQQIQQAERARQEQIVQQKVAQEQQRIKREQDEAEEKRKQEQIAHQKAEELRKKEALRSQKAKEAVEKRRQQEIEQKAQERQKEEARKQHLLKEEQDQFKKEQERAAQLLEQQEQLLRDRQAQEKAERETVLKEIEIKKEKERQDREKRRAVQRAAMQAMGKTHQGGRQKKGKEEVSAAAAVETPVPVVASKIFFYGKGDAATFDVSTFKDFCKALNENTFDLFSSFVENFERFFSLALYDQTSTINRNVIRHNKSVIIGPLNKVTDLVLAKGRDENLTINSLVDICLYMRFINFLRTQTKLKSEELSYQSVSLEEIEKKFLAVESRERKAVENCKVQGELQERVDNYFRGQRRLFIIDSNNKIHTQAFSLAMVRNMISLFDSLKVQYNLRDLLKMDLTELEKQFALYRSSKPAGAETFVVEGVFSATGNTFTETVSLIASDMVTMIGGANCCGHQDSNCTRKKPIDPKEEALKLVQHFSDPELDLVTIKHFVGTGEGKSTTESQQGKRPGEKISEV